MKKLNASVTRLVSNQYKCQKYMNSVNMLSKLKECRKRDLKESLKF